MTGLAVAAFALAVLPFAMTAVNLRLLRVPPLPAVPPSVAILIPARNEEATIEACVRAALASRGADVEVVVLDDHSTDRTAAVVAAMAATEPRLRLARAPALPVGWNGKQHACTVLATLTDRPNLLFIDADVLLEPEAAARLAPPAGVDLVSAVPRQIMATAAERLVIPMINALILGYLPVFFMRRDGRAALAAGCGQMMMVRRDPYRATGGHAAIRTSLHDGLKLPRLFRARGFRTDLVGGARLATCRMYAGTRAVWNGFLKNATEGMAKPLALPVWTALLAGGHVLPWLLLAAAAWRGGTSVGQDALLATACLLPLGARLLQALACGEPVAAVLLHPFGILVTLAIQWTALVRRWRGRQTVWRGRAYAAGS